MPWYFRCKGLMLTFLMFVENGFFLSCVSLPKRASPKICLAIRGLYLFYTFDFSTIRWLRHDRFTYSYHLMPQSMTPSDLYACGSLSQSLTAESLLRPLLLLLSSSPSKFARYGCVYTLTMDVLVCQSP